MNNVLQKIPLNLLLFLPTPPVVYMDLCVLKKIVPGMIVVYGSVYVGYLSPMAK